MTFEGKGFISLYRLKSVIEGSQYRYSKLAIPHCINFNPGNYFTTMEYNRDHGRCAYQIDKGSYLASYLLQLRTLCLGVVSATVYVPSLSTSKQDNTSQTSSQASMIWVTPQQKPPPHVTLGCFRLVNIV